MGMFDYVKCPEVLCPECDRPLEGWQSKGGECVLDTVDFSELNNFYTSCECGVWIEFNRIIPPDVPLSGYEMTVRND